MLQMVMQFIAAVAHYFIFQFFPAGDGFLNQNLVNRTGG